MRVGRLHLEVAERNVRAVEIWVRRDADVGVRRIAVSAPSASSGVDWVGLVAGSSPEPSLVGSIVSLCSDEEIHVLHVRRIGGYLSEPASNEHLVEQLVTEPYLRKQQQYEIRARPEAV